MASCRPSSRCVERTCCMGIRQRVTEQDNPHLLRPLHVHLYLNRPHTQAHAHAHECVHITHSYKYTQLKNQEQCGKRHYGNRWGMLTVSSVPSSQDSVTFSCSEDQTEHLSRADKATHKLISGRCVSLGRRNTTWSSRRQEHLVSANSVCLWLVDKGLSVQLGQNGRLLQPPTCLPPPTQQR